MRFILALFFIIVCRKPACRRATQLYRDLTSRG
jgi:hypothetical protein